MSVTRKINEAIEATREEDYLRALTLFVEVYRGDEVAVMNAKAATGLSFFGLCVALVQKKYKVAIDLCKRALELEFYNGDHYINLMKVYVAAGNRKKALETIEAGLRLHPEDQSLHQARRSLGVRARPAVPFLERGNPINVSLGQKRYAKKLAKKGS
ncbi:MAG TPA: tetratricopeptide repeat protein [Thermoanaerobaculia bacterium]|nr:tetratricopeptide repeat protein [Thermoanaerobaculia bacterium]